MKTVLKIVMTLMLFWSASVAEETGSASIFAFFNGTALENNEVLLDGEYKYYTDEDGSVELVLEVGEVIVLTHSKEHLVYYCL